MIRRLLTECSCLFAVLAVLALGACAAPTPTSSADTDKVDVLFANWNKSNAPGCSVGISRNGRSVYEHGYGVANLDLGVAITPDTVFDVASVSKQFTAMSILLLAERRQLTLDDDVAKYIPGWGERVHHITIRNLLTHTSGMRDAFLLQGLAPERPVPIHQQIVDVLTRARGFNFDPGTRFEYNNGAYTLLAEIVQRVSGQPLAVFADANIFKPLGMTHTHFHDDATRVVPNRATGYSQGANGFRVVVRTYTDTVVGNAGLFTTAGDLLRWEQNLADARVGGRTAITEMQTPAIATGWSDTSHYGFGVEIAEHRGLRTISHGGGDDGRRSHVVRYPDRELAIAVLCNRDDLDPGALTRSIAEIFVADAFTKAAASTATAPAVSVPVEKLQEKVGLYRGASDDTVGRIFIRDGKLMASEDASDSGGYELTPIASNRFVIVGSPIVAEFVPATSNTPQQFVVTGAGSKPSVSQLITTPFAPSRDQLRAFEGTYTSEELHGTYIVAIEGTGLVVEIPGRSKVPLQPVFTDAFGGNMFGVAKFSRDAHGNVTGFTANAAGIRGMRFTRVRELRANRSR